MSGGSVPVVYEECIDEEYEPTEEEITEYAKFLGIDPVNEKQFLYIAREGLKAPLPPDWKAVQLGDSEDIYYFNFRTKESVWDHPSDDYFRKLYASEKQKYTEVHDTVDKAETSVGGSKVSTESGSQPASAKPSKTPTFIKELEAQEAKEREQYFVEYKNRRKQWIQEMQALEAMERKKFEDEKQQRIGQWQRTAHQEEEQQKLLLESEYAQRFADFKQKLDQQKNAEIHSLIKNSELIKKDAESYLQEQEKHLQQAKEKEIQERLDQMQRQKELELQRQLEIMEANYRNVMNEQKQKLEEEFRNKEFQEKILRERHLESLREKIRKECEVEELMERSKLKAESKQRIESIKKEMEHTELELQNMIAEHKERKEALLYKKNQELNHEQIQVEQIEKELNQRKDNYDKQIKALEDAWRIKINKKKHQKEKLERKLADAKQQQQQELIKLEQKFEEQKRELDTQIEKVQLETIEQTKALEEKKRQVMDKLAQELQQFEDQERKRIEQEKQAILAKLEQDLKQTEDRVARESRSTHSAKAHKRSAKTKPTKLTDWSTTIDVSRESKPAVINSKPLHINITTHGAPNMDWQRGKTETSQLSPIHTEQYRDRSSEIDRLKALQKQLDSEAEKLQRLKASLHERSKVLHEKQSHLLLARENWRHSAKIAEQVKERDHTSDLLNDTKKDLEYQTHLLNEDVRKLKQTKERLKINESRLHKAQTDIQNTTLTQVSLLPSDSVKMKEEQGSMEDLLATVERIETSICQLVNDIQNDIPSDRPAVIDHSPEPQPPVAHQHHFRRKIIPSLSNHGQFKQKLTQWSNDRAKASEILHKHSAWLTHFKLQLAQPLLPIPVEDPIPATTTTTNLVSNVDVHHVPMPLHSKAKQVAIYIS